MDPTQDPNAGIPAAMQPQSSPMAQAFSLVLTKMFDQLMQQWLAQRGAGAQGAMGNVGGPGAMPQAMPPGPPQQGAPTQGGPFG